MTLHLQPRVTRAPARLRTVDCLRGIAASAVVWFHLTNGNPDARVPDWLKATGRHGWLGVEAFFVISGFVIPYALYKARYRLHDYGAYLLRRIVRLDPPYLMSMVVAMAVAYVSAAALGSPPPSYSTGQVLTHFAYLNKLLGYRSIQPVYWSLSLEFQYYLLLGLLFPLIVSASRWIRWGTIAVLAASALVVRSDLIVFSWFFLFILGILSFYYREGMVSAWEYGAGLAVAALGVWYTLGVPTALVGLASALVITFVDLRSTALLWLGDISYSLYLFHVPIASRVVNLGTRLSRDPVMMVPVVFVAFGVAVLSAYFFHRLVERPARAWAEKVAYGSHRAKVRPQAVEQPLDARLVS